ncbi:hypothetical protein ABZP36_019809 [Zizania latifolia]
MPLCPSVSMWGRYVSGKSEKGLRRALANRRTRRPSRRRPALSPRDSKLQKQPHAAPQRTAPPPAQKSKLAIRHDTAAAINAAFHRGLLLLAIATLPGRGSTSSSRAYRPGGETGDRFAHSPPAGEARCCCPARALPLRRSPEHWVAANGGVGVTGLLRGVVCEG